MSAFGKFGVMLNKQSPTILTTLGLAGLFGSVALAVKATPKALQAIENEERFRHEEYFDDRPLEPLDVIKVTWKHYIPTASVMLTTAVCMISANHISSGRIATLTSIASLADSSLRKYQKAVIEEVGDKKENKIRGRLANTEVGDDPPDMNHVIQTNQGATLFRDGISGRYFYSDIEFVKRTINEFNKRLMSEMSIPLNEFYADLYLPPIDIGGQLGWDIEKGMIDADILPGITSDGILCAVLSYKNMPVNIWG